MTRKKRERIQLTTGALFILALIGCVIRIIVG